MSPKEKAKELYDKMYYCFQGNIDDYTAKQCALIAVDEMLKHMSFHFGQISLSTLEYWNQVKHEIEKL